MNSTLFTLAFSAVLLSTLIPIEQIRVLFHPLGKGNESLKDNFEAVEVIPIAGAVGPESFTFDPDGSGPYTGVSDGRIIKWQEDEHRWIDFATISHEREECGRNHSQHQREHICGRPLGLKFNKKTGELYIADAYMGLLVVGPTGGLATKVPTSSESDSLPLGFTNALDIDQTTGVVYFTDSSLRYRRRNHISVIVSGDKTGRLMKYDPKSKEMTLVLGNLSFPNGVALAQNGEFILVAETTACRILKVWLHPTNKAATVQVFSHLPGFPDNIKRNSKGEFWVGIHSRRGKLLQWILSLPWVGKSLVRLPLDITAIYNFLSGFGGCGLALKLSEDGNVAETLEDRTGEKWKFVSEVEEGNGHLWIGSVRMPFVAKQKMQS